MVLWCCGLYLLPVRLFQEVPVFTVDLESGWKRRVETRQTCGQHLDMHVWVQTHNGCNKDLTNCDLP